MNWKTALKNDPAWRELMSLATQFQTISQTGLNDVISNGSIRATNIAANVVDQIKQLYPSPKVQVTAHPVYRRKRFSMRVIVTHNNNPWITWNMDDMKFPLGYNDVCRILSGCVSSVRAINTDLENAVYNLYPTLKPIHEQIITVLKTVFSPPPTRIWHQLLMHGVTITSAAVITIPDIRIGAVPCSYRWSSKKPDKCMRSVNTFLFAWKRGCVSPFELLQYSLDPNSAYQSIAQQLVKQSEGVRQ